MKVSKVLPWLTYFLIPFTIMLVIEAIKREGLAEMFEWLSQKPYHAIITYVLILLVQTLFFSLSKNVYIVSIFSVAFSVLWILVDANKLEILGEPLLPWDLFFFKQLVNLMPAIYKELNLIVVFIVISSFILSVILVAKKFNLATIKIPSRIILVIFSVTVLVTVGSYKENFVGDIFAKSGIALLEWDQKLTQNLNGVVLGFVLNIPSVLIDKPQNYSKVTMQELKSTFDESTIEEKLNSKPNIIMIMSEAFWDIGNMSEEITLQNYIPNVERLQVGNIVSPQFGGGTANVEFEALTGLSMNLLPAGSIAYQQYVKRPTPSLASLLAEEGYQTTAIHTYFKWFWDRENVYKNLGFQKFISVSEMPEAINKGVYIGDEEITNQIITEVENNEEPVFIYAVTMQNHGSYNYNRYGETTIEVPGNYESETQTSFNTYVTGLVDGDRELGNLVNYLENQDEPSIVVFFGDHLPMMGPNYKSYIEMGYIHDVSGWSLQEHLKMKQTPLVIWNNYGEKQSELGSISPSFLAPTILELANIQQPELVQFLNDYSSNMPVYTTVVKQDKDGQFYKNRPKQLENLEEQYKLIQYDILFGEQYLYLN